MNEQRLAIYLSILTVIFQPVSYFLSGVYSVGARLEKMDANMLVLNHEVKAKNDLQDIRINQLEANANK